MDALRDSLKRLSELLDHEGLEPDIDRTDWHEHEAQVNEVRDEFREQLLRSYERACRELERGELMDSIGMAVCNVGALAVAVVHASGAHDDAARMMAELCDVRAPGWREELEAGRRDMESFTRLMYGRWLVGTGDPLKARTLFEQVLTKSGETALVEEARVARLRAKPLESAPALFQWYGCGVSLYGSRDRIGDTRVATHCISILWIPVMPLAAYRVADMDDSRYAFLMREPLSRFAVWYRRLALAAVAIAIAALFIKSYLNDPARLAEKAFERAHAAERAGDRESAIERYENLAREWESSAKHSTLDKTGQALARLYLQSFSDPFTAGDVDRAVRVIRRFENLPMTARTDAARAVMLDRILAWSDTLGASDADSIQASLRLLDAAARLATPSHRQRFDDRRLQLQVGLGHMLEADWPLAALTIYAEDLGSAPGAMDEAARVLEAIGHRPALLEAGVLSINLWIARAEAAREPREHQSTILSVRAHLDEMRAAVDETTRKSALESMDEKALASWLEAHPWDQEVAVALAGNRATAGDAEGAIGLLESFGGPGWCRPQTLELLISLYMDNGRMADAEAILEQQLSFRLPRMLAASRAYMKEAQATQERLILNAQAGMLPPELERELTGKSDAEQQRIFANWLSETLQKDQHLRQLRDRYTRYSDVVPMTVTAGMLKLQRANQSTGEARAQLLDEAEKVFLSIRDDAEGLPEYHLGLGQVYHRLGKTEEGDAELEKLLAQDNPESTLAVASAYRQLGLLSRAKGIAIQVWESGQAPHHQSAAYLLGVMESGDFDAAEMWYQRADNGDAHVRISLREVQARRLARDGDYEAADQAMAEVAAFHAKNAAHDGTSANNAAVAYLSRFQYTAEKQHLIAAKRYFDQSLALQPDNAIVLSNTAETYLVLGMVEVLEKWLAMDLLQPDTTLLGALVDSTMNGPLRAQILDRMRKNKNLGRARELTEQQIVLAPKSTGGYTRLIFWYQALGELEKLRALHTSATQQAGFDTAEDDDLRKRSLAGEFDDEFLTRAAAEIERKRQLAQRAVKHPSTRAALQVALAELYIQRGRMSGDGSDFRAAVQALREADASWPGMGAKHNLSRALLYTAIVSATESAPALAASWSDERRIYQQQNWLHRAITGEHGEANQAALRAQPELVEAAALALESAHIHATSWHWVVARAAGANHPAYRELEELGAGALAREQDRLQADLNVLLAPNDPDDVYSATLHANR